MKPYPEPVVGAFILNPEHEILLVKSPKWKQGQLWSVPGGHIEMGETISKAVKREVLEVVGLAVDFKEVICIWENIYPVDFQDHKHFIFLECLCISKGKSIVQIDNQEITKAQWFTLKEALALPLETFTQKTLELLNHTY